MKNNKSLKIIIASLLLLTLIFSFSPRLEVQAASGKTAYVDIKSGYLNVRSGPGSKHKSVGKLYNKDKLNVLSVKNGWAKFTYKGKSSYTSNDYLRYYKTMSKTEAKKLTDKAIKLQDSLDKSYTKKQIKAKLSPAFTDAFINKFIKYDFWKSGKDKSGNTLYQVIPTDFPYYYIMYGFIWDDAKAYERAQPVKVTYYKKKGKEYLLVSQKYYPDELYSNVEQKVYFSRSSSNAKWRVYNTRW
ncbi:SH3 domain-containing protein [Peribacillus sp. NPDC097295]|uniref:SH3 domain-containing protein n=1 Tax=Peribacillus sp. NPDC097295 TaxID=3364402 RepID=UPI00382B8857